MKKLALLTAAATILAAVGLVIIVPVIAGMTITSASVTAINCQFAFPKPEWIAITMQDLTDEPVGQAQWDRYHDLIKQDTTYDASTPEQRDEALNWIVRYIHSTSTERSIGVVPLTWWLGELPGENDETWRTTPVPGWDGTLDTYMDAYASRYAQVAADNTGDQSPCEPTNALQCPQPEHMPAILATIRQLESNNDYTERRRARVSGAPSKTGWPSGAYQFIYTTWNHYDGYNEAWEAPPAVQDTRATADVTRIMNRFGDVAAVPLSWYIGEDRAADALADPEVMNTVPNPEHNTLTPAEYRDKWMDIYVPTLIAYGVTPTPCPSLGELVVTWAEGEIGTPYASVSPYRFGRIGWPGGTHCASWGTCYTYPAGTKVYDCSGFVLTAWQQVGIDLMQFGIYASQGFDNPNLDDVTAPELLPGDIAVYSPLNGIGHVVMVYSNINGDVRTIEATGSGVRIGTMNWERVTALKRVRVESD